MEALNVAGLTPISVLSKPTRKSRKFSSLPTNSLLNSSNSTKSNIAQQHISKRTPKAFHGGLALFSSVFNAGLAQALTYQEALGQSVSSPASTDSFDFDVGGVLDGVLNYGTENPIIVIGGAAVLVVPLVVSQFFKKPKPWGVESAKTAFAKLAEEGAAQLLDIRAAVELKQVGSPDLKGLKKKAVALAYKGEDKPAFLKKLELKFKEPEKTTLFILDKFDGNSELVAELVTVNGFKAAYAIKDGAEGPRGWMNSGLPWKAPSKTLSFDLSEVTDAFNGAVEGYEAVSVILGIAAATGLGLLAFTEVETILQVLGTAAILQFVTKKLLFADSRKETIQQLSEFVETKIAPNEFVDEIKQIGKALLPLPVTAKALPAPAEASPNPVPITIEDTAVKAEAAPVPEEATSPVNSAPITEVKKESPSGVTKSLSPYPYYPDFKPPTTPSPSQP